ncbi:hypothetical protein [Actinomyces minihominis]|uniref:hypothetical protein n=1 Tax=Actinomyces minihominis TaxID=2002838 RepID=UPI000C06D448|nr:hypothetical protein [Actinomyces minihominis]
MESDPRLWIEKFKVHPTSLDLRGLVPHTALKAVRNTVKNLFGNMKHQPVPGRNERILKLVTDTVLAAPAVRLLPDPEELEVRVDVQEGFGKPLLITIDLVATLSHSEMDQYSTEERQTLKRIFTDLLDRAATVAWDNPEVAPVGVRGRVLVVTPADEGGEQYLVADMTDLGFEDEIARVSDLYERLGAPDSDPDWRP